MLKHYDWSLLIVLDACRYDYFALHNTIPGKLYRFITPSAWTVGWVQDCFPYWYPITYVSANPYISSKHFPSIHPYKAGEHFKEVIDVWNFGWDNKLQTVPPQEVAKAVLSLPSPGKVIAHFMQPHSPYIGNPPLPVDACGHARAEKLDGETYRELPHIEDAIRTNGREPVIEAYVGNLRLVLGEVRKLVENWDGRTVVTADHGEAFGEHGVYAHPGVRIPETTEVPWLEVERVGKK